MEEIKIKEIADKFFEEQEKLNISYDSREAFIEGYKLAKEMEKDQKIEFACKVYNENYLKDKSFRKIAEELIKSE